FPHLRHSGPLVFHSGCAFFTYFLHLRLLISSLQSLLCCRMSLSYMFYLLRQPSKTFAPSAALADIAAALKYQRLTAFRADHFVPRARLNRLWLRNLLCRLFGAFLRNLLLYLIVHIQQGISHRHRAAASLAGV